MQTRQTTSTRRPLGRFLRFAGLSLLGTALGGCAGFLDDLKSRDYAVAGIWKREDPIALLQSPDGAKRARGLRALREPKQHGGSDAQQDEVLRILADAAVNDRQPLCRFAAIASLGRFKDPRAVQVLESAYYQAGSTKSADGLQTAASFAMSGAFPPETVALIRCQALMALGETNNPAAVDHLLRVLKQPATDGTEAEKQPNLDERVAAARALGNFVQYEATEALIGVLRDEKDVALRGAAHASLQKMTGKKLPPDAKEWTQTLRTTPPPRRPEREEGGNETAPPPRAATPTTERPPPVWPDELR